MTKTAFERADHDQSTLGQSSRPKTRRPSKPIASANADRFPPIECVLIDIVRNKRLLNALEKTA
ncbi:hypothetical protein [Ruegeria sp. HKCCD8929]|uniref:hypothetical protein n=1 Tax=Ruegeria sp. HKCCD8929 TaxID=2683006 RepID=UPI001489E739|nr:hypothetical protein [Ruegeria sp. HKCCD8929]